MTDQPESRVAHAAQDIGGFIRAQREGAQVSLRQLAALAGVSNPYLSQIERGLRNPSAEVLGQIAKALRVSSEVLYVRAGFLEQRPHSPVRDALLADTSVSERQKQVLLEIYESFRRENGEETGSGGTNETVTFRSRQLTLRHTRRMKTDDRKDRHCHQAAVRHRRRR